MTVQAVEKRHGIIREIFAHENFGWITDTNWQEIRFILSSLTDQVSEGMRVQFDIQMVDNQLIAVDVENC
ncbi:hypothetical protein [Pedobacter aquatilis]|uniref:hypothetical protein n=1 Tax=Pedobacter aquatilis TaxID=351343 RepID=UPI0029300895|nr:hypothetical protein [Pedobacter aquatilis]